MWKRLNYLFVSVLALLENPPLLSNVPIEFPKNESQYPFVHNTTILRVLASQTINDSEVDDLLRGGRTPTISRLEHVDISETITQDNNLQSNLSDRKWDTELIQNSDKTEDYLFSNKTKFQPTRHTSYGSRLPLVHGEIAAILAIVLVLLIVLGYVGLVSWRRYIE